MVRDSETPLAGMPKDHVAARLMIKNVAESGEGSDGVFA
jgi:hypothetical protein